MANIIMADVKGGTGGAQLIASGTWTGAGVPNAEFFVGKKMPKQDFVFRVFAPDGEEFPMNADYKISMFYADSAFAVYDLSADSNNCPRTSKLNYVVDDNGTLKTLSQYGNWWAGTVRNASALYLIQGNVGYNRIKRTSSGFSVLFQNYTQSFYWVSGKTYNWELLYFGSNAENDIVEVP